MKTFPKQPNEVLDFDFDYRDFLTDRGGDTITAAVVTVDQPGLTIESSLIIDGVLVKFYASGGTNGVKYKVTCSAQTVGGRMRELEMMVQVKET